jgi:serine/threonine-protein kinase
LQQRLVEDEAARSRFHTEARAAVKLRHPNAVSVTDFGQTAEGVVYIVMELLEGRTLREILSREAPIETARAISLMLQTAAAVAAAHEAGIIHRDLKPSNILVTQSADQPAVVKVLDFGIATFTPDDDDDNDMTAAVHTNSVIGTPRYMSPEQHSGDELTPAADVYSLGVILYEMLSGMVPFSGSTPAEIAQKHANDLPHSPREIVAAIPEDVERIVLKALEKRPDDRFANAAEFHHELLETAERLGLEHHALKSAPDIEALRDAGVESPSGRLVVDITRLREKRALSSGSNEIKVLGASPVEKSPASDTKPAEPSSFLDKVKRILGL